MNDINTADALSLNEEYAKLKRLWINVLFQALSDCSERSLQERRGAYRWLNSENQSTGSCRWICDILDVDWMQLRLAAGDREVMKMAKDRLRKHNEKIRKLPLHPN